MESHRNLHSILYRWDEWGNKEDVRKYVGSLIISNEGLVRFITTFSGYSTSQSMGDYVSRKNPQFYMKNLNLFINSEVIEPRVRQIYASEEEYKKYNEKEKEAIKNFLDRYDDILKDDF